MSLAGLAHEPADGLRRYLAAVNEQIDTCVALGFYTPAEADVLRPGAPEPNPAA